MEINVEKTNFHPVLKDIENMNWFFVLSHKVLARPDVQDIVKKVEDPSIIYMLEKYNKWVNLQIEINGNNTHTSKLNVLDSMIFTGKMMSILLYEFLASSSYNEVIEKNEEFQFLKCIRNGAAHDNKFDFKYKFGKNKGQWMIKEDEIIKWNGVEINRKLQGSTIFNDFISLFSIFLLAEHFSKRLIEIDKEKKV